MTRVVVLVLVAMLVGVGCERHEATPKLRVDPAVLKAMRDKDAREKAAAEKARRDKDEKAAADARAHPPTDAELLADAVAWREQECASTGQWGEGEDNWMFDYALERAQRERGGREPERARLGRSISLIPAAARGDLARLRLLIRQGADVNFHLPLDVSLSPLAWAARCDHPEAVDLLVRAGARVNKPLLWAWGRASYTNSSALIWASRGGSARAIEALLRRGARPMRETVETEDGFAPGQTPYEVAPTRALKRRLAGRN